MLFIDLEKSYDRIIGYLARSKEKHVYKQYIDTIKEMYDWSGD